MNMLSQLRTLLLLATLAFGLMACDKEDDVNPAGGPTIEVSSPSDDATYTSGDTLRLRGTISDPDELHEYEIKLVCKKATGDSLHYQFSEHKHAKSVNIDRDIRLMVMEHSDMELIIKASNHDGKVSQKVIHLHVHPSSMGGTDTTRPTIVIDQPAANAEYTNDQTARLLVTLSDNERVRKYRLSLVRLSDNTVLQQDSADHVGQMSVQFSHDFELTGIAPGTQLALKVEVWDKSLNYATKSVNISIVSGVPADVTPPSVTITAPTDGAVVNGGTPLNVVASITDDQGLAEYKLTVTRNGVSIFSDTVALTGTNASVNRNITFSAPMHSDLVLTLLAKDRAGNQTTQTVDLHAH